MVNESLPAPLRALILPVRLVWRVLIRVAGFLMLPVSGAVWCLRLLRHAAEIRSAEVVVLMVRPSGFGHSIQGTDATRRFYPGRKCVFIAPYWNFKYNPEFNPYVAKLWSDITVFFLPRFALAVQYRHRVTSVPFVRSHDRMIVRLTAAVTRLLAGKDVIFKDLIEVYREARERGLKKKDDGGVFPPVARSAESVESWQAYEYEIGYMYLIKERENLAPICLPDDIREDMKNRIRDVWRKTGGTGPVKLCCLYLRFERRESYTTRLRNSSTVETYLPAVRLLNEAGYQVLLTGDREMTPEIRREFAGKLVGGHSIGTDKELFQLFAATEADIFIGNNGGGITPALANGTPGLYLDWFPFFMGYPNSWFYFKAVSTEEGKMVAPKSLITDHVYDLGCSFGVLESITSGEIRDAVAHFIEDVENPQSCDPCAHIAALIPEDTPFHLSGARLSPAWVHNHFLDSSEQAGSQSVIEK